MSILKEGVDLALEHIAEGFKKVNKLIITLEREQTEIGKRKKKIHNKDSYRYIYEYTFDSVKIVDNSIIATGRTILIENIEKDFRVVSIAVLDDDDNILYERHLHEYYDSEGDFSFNGRVFIDMSGSL